MRPTIEYRVRFVTDDDARFEECNGEARPLTETEYAENQYMKDGQPVPYADYLDYYGNPERHIYVECEVQRRAVCPCCKVGVWSHLAGLCNIDFMDDNPEAQCFARHAGDWFTPTEAIALPGYLGSVAKEVLAENKYRLPKHVFCARKGCTFFHVDGQRFCGQHTTKTTR